MVAQVIGYEGKTPFALVCSSKNFSASLGAGLLMAQRIDSIDGFSLSSVCSLRFENFFRVPDCLNFRRTFEADISRHPISSP